MSDDTSKRKGRSPSYPAIDLEQAVERAATLLAKENRHWVPVDTALEAWGYSQNSGAGLVVVAALKKFGLLEDQGSTGDRRVRLTEIGYEIVIDEREHAPERTELLRQAALRPRIHAELWDRYGSDLPSDSTLRFELRKMLFTDDAANKLIVEWRTTLEYAELLGSAVPESQSPATSDLVAQGTPALPAPAGAGSSLSSPASPPLQVSANTQSVQLPLSQERWAVLAAPFPLSELEWTQMMGILQAMKPALTASSESGD